MICSSTHKTATYRAARAAAVWTWAACLVWAQLAPAGPSADPPSSNIRKSSGASTGAPRRTHSRSTSRTPEPQDYMGPPAERSAPVSDSVLVSPENIGKPPEERWYKFSIKDGTYADLIDGFQRATGVAVIGERPPGGPVNFESAEELTYEEVLSRIRNLLFSHPQQYYIQKEKDGFAVRRVSEMKRFLPDDRIFVSEKLFTDANLDQMELVMVLYTPQSGTIDDVTPFRDFLPDYVQTAQFQQTNSITMFALARDVNKFIDLVKKFSERSTDDPRKREFVQVRHISATQALNTIKQMVDGFSDAAANRPRVRGAVQAADANVWPIEAVADDANRRILFRAVPEKIQEIRDFLALIDIRESRDFDPVVIQLQHIAVEDFLSIANPILTGAPGAAPAPQPRRGRPAKPAPAANVNVENLTIIPRPDQNQLIVVGDDEQVQQVNDLVAQFDVEQPDPYRRVEIENASDLDKLVTEAQTLFDIIHGDGSGLRFVADPSGTSVIIAGGTAADIEGAVTILTELDVAQDEETLHKARLQHAKPSAVANMLKALDAGAAPAAPPAAAPRRGRQAPRRPTAAQQTGEKFQGDDATNMLYVLCSDEEWDDRYWPLIQDLDADAEPVIEWQRIPVANADPQEIVETLQQILTQMGLAEAVKLAADVDAVLVDNSVSSAQLKRLEELVARYDTDELQEQRTFKLKYITPAEARGVIQALILDQAGPQAPVRRPPRRGNQPQAAPVSVNVPGSDVRIAELGDSLLVVAPTETMEEIASLLAELDVPRASDTAQVHFFELEYADVNQAAQTVKSVLDAKYAEAVAAGTIKAAAPGGKGPAPSTVLVEPDAAGGRLLVMAPGVLMTEAEMLIDQLDREDGERVVRTVKLERADAIEMANTINAMLGAGTRSVSIRRPDRSGGRRGGPPGSPPTPAASVASASGQDVTVMPAPGGNALVLAGYADRVDEVETWVKMLDAEVGEGSATKVYQFTNCDVEDFADIVMTFLDSGGLPPKPQGKEESDWFAPVGGPRAGKDIKLVTDPYGGTMVVMASQAKIAQIDSLHALYEGTGGEKPTLGSGTTPPPAKMIELKYADPYDAVFALEGMLEKMLGEDKAPKVDSIAFTQYLTVAGDPDTFPVVEDLIARFIDKPSKEQTEVKTLAVPIPRVGLTAREIALILQSRLPGVPIEVDAANPNAIDYESLIEQVTPLSPGEPANSENGATLPCVLPACLDADLEALLAASTALADADEDELAGPAPTTQPVHEQKQPTAEDVRRAVTGTASPAAESADAETEASRPEQVPVKVRYDNETGVLILEGMGRDLTDIREMLDKLGDDLGDVPLPPDIRVYRMKYVDVRVAAQLLEAMFNMPQQRIPTPRGARGQQPGNQPGQPGQPEGEKGGRRPGEPGQPTPEQQAQQQAQQQQQMLQQQMAAMAAASGLRVVPDPRTRTLVIRAATQDFPTIVKLLATIDRKGDKPEDFKIIELKKLNAGDVEDLLKSLLGIGARRTSTVRSTPRGANAAAAAAAAAQMGEQIIEMAGAEEAGINVAEDINLTSNPATNTLMVMGPPPAIKLVEEFVAKLEAQEVPARELRTIPMKYADANKIAPQLEKLFKAGASSGRGRGPEGYDPSGLNDPTVIVDEDGNALVISALSIDFPKIEPLIEALDQEKDVQVMEFPLPTILDATKVMKALSTVYSDKGRGGAKRVTIAAESETNTVLVTAPPELRAEITERIANMKTKALEESKPTVIPVKNATPTTLAQTLLAALGQAGRNAAITIIGDDGTMQLFVRAPEELIPQIESMVTMLDVPLTSPVQLRIFQLKHAQATQILEQMLSLVRQLGAALKNTGAAFGATADARTNSIMVMGSTATFQIVEQVLLTLDVPPPPDAEIVTTVYHLVQAKANDVAQHINRLYSGRAADGSEPPRAEADAPSNTLIVRGTRKQQDEIKAQVIDKLEEYAGTPPIPLVTETIQLAYLNADDAATQVTQEFANRQKAYRDAQLQNINPAELTVSVTPRVSSKQIVVVASQANIDQIKTMVAELDKEGAGKLTAREARTYSLEWLDANAAANAINTMFRVSGVRMAEIDQVSTAVVSTTQMVVTASADNHEVIANLLKELDVDKGQGKVQQFYTMKNARASDVANTVNQVIGVRGRTRTGQLPVTVVPDDAMNLLVLSGTPAEIEEVQQIVVQLDQEPANLTGRVPEVYDLKYADPGSTINALNAAFPRTRGQRPEDEVAFGYTWGTSALVATASPQNQAKIKELLGKIDIERTSRTTHLIPLKEANADEVAQKLQSLFRATTRARQGDTTMQILAETRTNSLLVFATEAELMQVQAMVDSLDVAATGDAERTVQVYPVQFADPAGIVNAINAQYSQFRASPRDQVTAVVEYGTQSVVVSASAKRHAEVDALIKEIDVEGSQVRATRVVKIEHANAEDLARTLSTAFQRVSTRRGEQMRISADAGTNTLVVYASEKEMADLTPLVQSLDVEPDLEKDRQFRAFKLTYGIVWDVAEMITQSFRGGRTARDQVTAVPDWGSSSIFVTASPENMKRIEELIKQVDTKSDIAQQVRIVQVKHGDADSIAQTLTEVFSEGGGGGRRFWMPQRGGISITHTAGTDTLLIKARDTEFEEIMAVLEQLDTPERGPGEIRTFALKYMDATEMQGILETYLQKPGSSTGGRRGGGAAAGLSGDVRISVSSATNSLVVSGGKDQLDRLAGVIAQIDVEVLDGGNAPVFMKLKYATPSVIEPMLTQVFVDNSRSRGGRGASATQMVPVIVADDASDQLIVRANPTDMSQIRVMVETLDTEESATDTGIKIVQLQPGVDVTELADMLQELLDADAKVKESMGSGRGGKAQVDRVVLSADRRTNSILLAGARSRFEEVENLIRTLEKQGPVGGKTAVIIRPKNMSPDEIKGVLEGFMEDNASGSRGSGNRSRRR
ncbi:MAG: hypothetical protein JXB13_02505 [Phycisphaerae bacterium]|nr:hypothetical protein [Phycisphaerae bacterium]